MKTWNPFVVIENSATGPSANDTHVVVLRVKDCYDIEMFQGTEVDCYKECHELNKRIRISLSDFIEGKFNP